MKVYQVGGCIRNELLGLKPVDIDYVVVGATPFAMLRDGYKKVGKDFSVFLHPQSGEEYSLAGSRIFKPDSDCVHFKSASIDDDLILRDITINAIARDKSGVLIDPTGGLEDLENRVLREANPDSLEHDPIRILRIARFKATLYNYGFDVEPVTKQQMKQLTHNGALDKVTPERVLKEVEKALMSSKPSVFFEVLLEVGALEKLFPEIQALSGIEQDRKYHPEVDTLEHTLMSIDRAAQLQLPLHVRFATLLHDLGKALTPKELLPSHPLHENNGVPVVETFCKRFRVSADTTRFSMAVCKHHLLAHTFFILSDKAIIKLFTKLNGFRDTKAATDFFWACQADAQGRTGLSHKPYPQRKYATLLLEELKKIQSKDYVVAGNGNATANNLQHARLRVIRKFKKNHSEVFR